MECGTIERDMKNKLVEHMSDKSVAASERILMEVKWENAALRNKYFFRFL